MKNNQCENITEFIDNILYILCTEIPVFSGSLFSA